MPSPDLNSSSAKSSLNIDSLVIRSNYEELTSKLSTGVGMDSMFEYHMIHGGCRVKVRPVDVDTCSAKDRLVDEVRLIVRPDVVGLLFVPNASEVL